MRAKITKIVLVVCPNKHGIHNGAVDGVYVRYAMLYAGQTPVAWMDDPNFEDIRNIIFETGIEGVIFLGQCLWCQAHEQEM